MTTSARGVAVRVAHTAELADALHRRLRECRQAPRWGNLARMPSMLGRPHTLSMLALLLVAMPPAVLSTDRGLLVQYRAAQISEPVQDWGAPSNALCTGWSGNVANEWRVQRASGWRDSKFTRSWGDTIAAPGYGDPPGLLIRPCGVPVTVSLFDETGIAVLAQFDLGGLCDINLDGFVDVLDIELWTRWFEQGDGRADWNADGWLDPLDQMGFVNAFEGRSP